MFSGKEIQGVHLFMPNIKSAKKRVLVNNKKTEQNKSIRSAVRTEIKKIDALIKAGNLEEAKKCLSDAFKAIDMASSKNIIHANNASNKKAKLAKRIDAAAKVDAPVVEAPAEVAPVEEVVEAPKKTRKPRAKKAETEATAE